MWRVYPLYTKASVPLSRIWTRIVPNYRSRWFLIASCNFLNYFLNTTWHFLTRRDTSWWFLTFRRDKKSWHNVQNLSRLLDMRVVTSWPLLGPLRRCQVAASWWLLEKTWRRRKKCKKPSRIVKKPTRKPSRNIHWTQMRSLASST